MLNSIVKELFNPTEKPGSPHRGASDNESKEPTNLPFALTRGLSLSAAYELITSRRCLSSGKIATRFCNRPASRRASGARVNPLKPLTCSRHASKVIQLEGVVPWPIG